MNLTYLILIVQFGFDFRRGYVCRYLDHFLTHHIHSMSSICIYPPIVICDLFSLYVLLWQRYIFSFMTIWKNIRKRSGEIYCFCFNWSKDELKSIWSSRKLTENDFISACALGCVSGVLVLEKQRDAFWILGMLSKENASAILPRVC